MRSICLRHTLWTLPALAAGIIACGGEKGPTQPAAPTKLVFTVPPTNAAGAVSFAAVSAGGYRTCGVTAAGVAYCWGAGGLGDGTMTDRLTPVRVVQ